MNAELPNCYFIAMSGASSGAPEGLFDERLLKPFDADALLAAMARATRPRGG